ncbi:MAG: hypothetical protein EXR69_03190 [Myxococcales bacterium]|nr:hypothetical protein [Myxococcales bacterium]
MKLVYVGIDRQLHLISDWEGGAPRIVHLTTPPSFTLVPSPPESWSWPTWSPDGQWIAAFAVLARDDESGPARVVTTSVDGVRQTEWADLPDAAPLYLQWHPSGHALCALTQVDDDLRLGLIHADALGTVKSLAQGVPLFFNWTPDGSRLWVHHGERGKAGGSVLIRDPLGDDEDRLYARSPGSFCAPVFCAGRTLIALRPPRAADPDIDAQDLADNIADIDDPDAAHDLDDLDDLDDAANDLEEALQLAAGPAVEVDAPPSAVAPPELDEDTEDGDTEDAPRPVQSSLLVSCDLLGEGEREITTRPGLIALAVDRERAALSSATGGEGAPYYGIDIVDVASGETRRISEGPLLAFEWVPGGASLIVFRVDAPANCMFALLVDAVTGEERTLGTFWPTRDFFFWLHFFDQFVDSHPQVSADGEWLTWSGYPAGDGQADLSAPPRVWVRSLVDLDGTAIEVGRGSFASFAPRRSNVAGP